MDMRLKKFMVILREFVKIVYKEGVKIKINQGKVMMIFDGYLVSDYEGKWKGKPLIYFLRTIFDKYVFRRYFAKAEFY